MEPSELTSAAASSSSALRKRHCWQLARARRVRVSRRRSPTSSSPALHHSGFGPGSQPSGRASVAAKGLHCPRPCSWQTISVTGNLQPLWTQLRIATLAAIHSARTQRRKGIPTTATSVAARLVHQIRSAMLRDWQRVRGRNSLAALADGVCCSTWLKGRQPFISLEQFQQRWGEQGALY